MTDSVSISTIRTRVLRRADMENSDFVTDAEVDAYINGSIATLYNYLVGKYQDFFCKVGTNSSWGSGSITWQQDLDVPDDFFKLKKVSLDVTGNGQYRRLSPISWSEEELIDRGGQTAFPRHYIFHGQNTGTTHTSVVRLLPNPDKEYNIRFVYVPKPPTLTDGGASDSWNFIAGWAYFVEVDAAIKCLIKEQSDVRAHQAERQEFLNMIENAISPMDEDAGGHVITVDRTEPAIDNDLLEYPW